jgi:hypothetical protein
VSASKRTVTVSRAYRPDPDYCIRALAMLLEKPVKEAVEPAPEPDSCNDAAIVRNTEGVSHVEQRPDRPSEIVVTHSRKGSKAWSIFGACLGRNIGRASTA